MASPVATKPPPAPPFVVYPVTQTTTERDLRGDTTWYRIVGGYSADTIAVPCATHGGFEVRSTYPVQVSVVGDWRRSEPHAFASFCDAMADVIRIRTRQGYDADGRPIWPEPIECIECGAELSKVARSSVNADTCADCDGDG